MSAPGRDRVLFGFAAVGAVVTGLAAYYAFESSLPSCGPPRNTFLGRIYWLVPLGLLVAQGVVVALSGRKTRRTQSRTILVAMVVAVVSILGGVAIFLHFFAAGDCGE